MRKKHSTNEQPQEVAFEGQEGLNRQPTAPSPQEERLVRIRARIKGELPTVSELAALTASIERGKPLTVVGTGEAARSALFLWDVCRQHLESEIATRTTAELKNAKDTEEEAEIPRPEEFPASFADFERLIVPGKTEADRRETYRAFLLVHLPQAKRREHGVSEGHVAEATKDEVDAEITRNASESFGETFWFHRARQFLDWKEKNGLKTRSSKAAKGGRKKHANRETKTRKS